jgi:integrase
VKASPIEDVEGLGRRRGGKAQLRLDEARKLFAEAMKVTAPGATAVLCALLMGMRAGELQGRLVRDVDDAGRLLWITAAKTAAGKRTLHIPEVIRDRVLELAKGREPAALLFGDHSRGWVRRQTLKLCALAGVPPVCAHGLRGTFATLALELGIGPSQVAADLGHADQRVLYKNYAAEGAGETYRTDRVALKLMPGGRR